MSRHWIISAPRAAALLSAALCALASCGDSGRHGTASLIELGEYAWHMEWADHGQHLIVISGVDRKPLTGYAPEYNTERVAAHIPGTWELAGQAFSNEHMGDAFTCGDPLVVAVTEGSGPQPVGPYKHNISFYRLDSGERIQRHSTYGFYNRPSSNHRWFPYTYECDVAANVMYMLWANDKIVALDGSSGEVLREFIEPVQPEDEGSPSFFIQPGQDRLVWLERGYGASEVRTYRMSTAELLDSLCLTCGTEWMIVDYLLVDNDHLAAITGQLPGFCDTYTSSTAIAVVNLDTVEIEHRVCLPNRISGGAVVIPGTPVYLMVYVRKMPQDCWEVRTIDLATGDELPPYDLCSFYKSYFSPYPEVGRVLIAELEPDDGKEGYLWWMYTWPDYQFVNQGRQSHNFDWWVLLPERGFFASQSQYVDTFATVDALRGDVIDEFHFCTGVQEAALRVDPTGRWATTLCFGDWSEVHDQTTKPKGTGFAVVDLEQYDGW